MASPDVTGKCSIHNYTNIISCMDPKWPSVSTTCVIDIHVYTTVVPNTQGGRGVRDIKKSIIEALAPHSGGCL